MMVVETAVSSRKTSRRGSSFGCRRCRDRRSAATSGRSCSAARRLFFKGQLQMMKKTGNRRLADCDLFLRQTGHKLFQRDVRLVRHQLPNQFLMLCKREILVAAKLSRTYAAGFPVKFQEPDNRTDADPVVFCGFRYRGAIQNCLNRSSAQIFRIRLCHPCWPPASRTLESDSLWN